MSFDKGSTYSQSTLAIDGVDAMGNLGSSELSFPEGSSSTASFTKQIKDAVASRLSLPGLDTKIVTDQNRWPFAQDFCSVAELCVLPSRGAADKMMCIYWNEVHVLYPFFHRPDFQARYERLWLMEDDGSPNFMLYCHLNSIFAICCQLQRPSKPDQSALADVYFRRAAQLLQMNLFGSGSLETIQACLLLAQYLQSTEWSHRCFVVIGLAIRVAQSVSLHQAESISRLERQCDRQLSLRLWHGCVFLDR